MKRSRLIEPLVLASGVVLPNRLAMAPIMTGSSSPSVGRITEEDVAYIARRSRVAGTIISGAAYVTRRGRGFQRQISIADDRDIEGLGALARAMRRDGSAAIVQLYHGGREATPAVAEFGWTLAPSAQDVDCTPYVSKEMTAAEIAETISAYGAATRRAIAAGFDGVEIHGASHCLLQQFFSTCSNHRHDGWGGDLEGRMAFPLAVVDEVARVVRESPRPFALGYRLSPEALYGENVGYSLTELSELVDRVISRGVDYIHVSPFTSYDAGPSEEHRSYGQIVREVAAERCAVVIVSDVFTEYDAVRALDHGDIVAIGRAALIEPEFASKIAVAKGDQIETTIAGRLGDLDLPATLIEWYTGNRRHLLPPLPGIEEYLN